MPLKFLYVVFVIAVSCVSAVGVLYGLNAFVFLATMIPMFLLFFGVGYAASSLQAGAISGIEDLDEPDLFFSRIYMAWQFANDRETWAKYETVFSYVFGCLLCGSIFGVIVLVTWNAENWANYTFLLPGWALGMFITLLIAIAMATSEVWKHGAPAPKEEKREEEKGEEKEDQDISRVFYPFSSEK